MGGFTELVYVLERADKPGIFLKEGDSVGFTELFKFADKYKEKDLAKTVQDHIKREKYIALKLRSVKITIQWTFI